MWQMGPGVSKEFELCLDDVRLASQVQYPEHAISGNSRYFLWISAPVKEGAVQVAPNANIRPVGVSERIFVLSTGAACAYIEFTASIRKRNGVLGFQSSRE